MKFEDFKNLTEEFGLSAYTDICKPQSAERIQGLVEIEYAYYFVEDFIPESIKYINAVDYNTWFRVCHKLWKRNYMENIYA